MKCLFSYVKNKIPDNFCPETEQNFLILSFPVDMFSIFFCLFSPQKCPPVKIIHWNRVIFFPGKLFLLCDSKLKQKFPQKKKVLLKNVSWTFGKWKMKKKEVFSFFVCESDTKKHQDINTVCAWKGSLILSSLIIDNYLMWKFLAIKSCQHQSEITPETLSQREGGTQGGEKQQREWRKDGLMWMRGRERGQGWSRAEAWSIDWKIYFCSKQRHECAVGGPRRGEARRCCSANTERFNSSSYLLFTWVKWCGPTADTPPSVFDLVSQSERERLLCSGTFCANTSKSSLCLSHGQNQPRSLTRDTRRHETALGRDMNYHTEANLNKMNSWITNISCLLFFPSASCVPWCFKHESWGKWASLQPEKKKVCEW